MSKIIKYSFLTIAWFLIILTAIIVLALGIIQTTQFKEKLVSIVKNKAPDYINGSLTVGEIKGDFFTGLILNNILLLNASDTILYIPRLEASYNLLSLLHNRISVENIRINSPYINLLQINDSTWNIQQILKPTEPVIEDTVSGKTYDIDIATLEIDNGSINIHSPDTVLPKQLQMINSKAAFLLENDLMSVQLKSFSLLTKTPDMELKKLSFNLKQSAEFIRINGLILETSKNRLEGKVDYFTDKTKKSTITLKTAALRLDEFNYYLSDFKTAASPDFILEGLMRNDSINAVIEMSDQSQVIHLKLLSPNLYKWLTVKSDSLLLYMVESKFDNVKISHWMDIPSLNYTLNGEFTADGKGTDTKKAEVKISGTFNNLIIEGRKVDVIRADLDYNKGDLQGSMNGNGNFGDFSLVADVKDLLNEPLYQVNLITKNLNIGPLTGIDTMNSAINMTADLKGKGFDPKSLSAIVFVDVTPSQIQKMAVNSIKASVQYQQENLKVDSLHLQTNTLELKARGNYSFNSASDISLTADLQNMDEFASLLPLQDLKTSGHLEAHLTGQPDSLKIEANLDLPQIQYGEYLTGPVLVSAHGAVTPSDTTIYAHILSRDLSSGDFKLDSASLIINMANDLADISGHFVNKDLDTRFQTNLHLGALTKINLNDLAIDYKNQKWTLDQPPAVFEIGPKDYKISNFSMSNSRGDTIQSILAEGNISMEGPEDFNLSLRSIDIKKLTELTEQKLNASGVLNLNMNLEGTSSSPLLKGDFATDNAVFNDFPFAEVSGTINYQVNRMEMGMKILPRDSGKFELIGTMPLQLKLDSMSFNFNRKDSVNVSLAIEKFPLAAIKTINMIEQITGYIEGGVQMRGSIDSPDLSGNLQLKKASVKVPEYGIDYKDILFNVDFLRDKLRLDTLRIRTDKGSMTGNGELNFTSDFYKGNIGTSKVNFKYNGFKPIDHREVNMEVSGSSTLKGNQGEFVFDGNLEVPQSEIYLPALFNMLGKATTPEIPEPLLVQAMDTTKANLDTLMTEMMDTAGVDTAKIDYFKNLKGKLRFKIPKNSWIKNENMYVEISGDLELRKEQQFFEIFGNVDVVRGQYELLGRRFVIDKGLIHFEGGEEMLPDMSIQASYNFRNTQGVNQKLSVDIQGSTDSLGVEFTLDNNSINEGDALSYILFGKSMNELTLDQQQGLAGTGGTMAEQVAASLVSSQLTKFLGSKLNVDYLEIKSQGGFENASLTVGKYITKDLFASYEQQFGQTDIKGIPSYQLNLEYEVLKFLYLRMNNSSIDNGFDVIFKFEAK